MRSFLSIPLLLCLSTTVVDGLRFRVRRDLTTKHSAPITSGVFSSSNSVQPTTTSTITTTPTSTISSSSTPTSTGDCGFPSVVFDAWCGVDSNITKTLRRNIRDGVRNATHNHGIFYPLYRDATEADWKLVYDTAESYPKVTLTVVVKANSTTADPIQKLQKSQPLFVDRLEKLNNYSNVHVLGYVDSSAGREKSAVLAEIKTYASWTVKAKKTTSMLLDGIYLDAQNSSDNRTFLANTASYITAIEKAKPNFNHKALVGYGVEGFPTLHQLTLNTTFTVASAANTTNLYSTLFDSSVIIDTLGQLGPRERSKLVWRVSETNGTKKDELTDLINLQLAFDPKMFYLSVDDEMEKSGNGTWWKAAVKQIRKPVLDV